MFSGVRFELLGPVRGWRGDIELELGSPQQQMVLAMLLLARGRQVPLDSMVDGLWGEDVPKSAGGTVRTYVSRLRSCLKAVPEDEPDFVLARAGNGYSLRFGSPVLDVDIVERRLKDAREARQEGETGRAIQLMNNALALWRGEALAGVPGPWAAARRTQLADLYVTATEEKLAMDVMGGDHVVAVSDLREMLREHPFREGAVELLMLALYKSGRQAEALGVFDTVRHDLRDELGVDPGPSLRKMYQRILRADEDLIDVMLEEPVGVC
jgi:DNA-binding SARP family transcriptional activator